MKKRFYLTVLFLLFIPVTFICEESERVEIEQSSYEKEDCKDYPGVIKEEPYPGEILSSIKDRL